MACRSRTLYTHNRDTSTRHELKQGTRFCSKTVEPFYILFIEHVMHIHTAVGRLRSSERVRGQDDFRTSCPQSTAFITRVLRPPRALLLEATAQGRGRCLYSSSSDDKTCAWLDLLPEPPHGGRPGEIASDLNLLCSRCFGVFALRRVGRRASPSASPERARAGRNGPDGDARTYSMAGPLYMTFYNCKRRQFDCKL